MIGKIKSIGAKIGGAAILAGAYGTSALAQFAGNGIDTPSGDIPALTLSGQSMSDFIGKAISLILIIAGVLAVGYLIYGGILYVTAGGDSEKAGKGRVAITNAIIGVILIILSLVIYNTVIDMVTKGKL